jgi:hypothetical protein
MGGHYLVGDYLGSGCEGGKKELQKMKKTYPKMFKPK